LTPLLLPAYAGPSIRGALFGALTRHFCPALEREITVEHKALCPVCWLLATENPTGSRGRDVPRPYAIEPPLHARVGEGQAAWFEPGERFSFGLTLFAQAMNLFPYVVVAMPIIGEQGIGVPLRENGTCPGHKRRGRFDLCRIEAINPVTGEVTPVIKEGERTVHVPDLPASDDDVHALCQTILSAMDRMGLVRLRFLTPTRIVDHERLVKTPWMGPLVRRLLERLDALRGEYAQGAPVAERERLIAIANRVHLVEDDTRWVEVKSRSSRLGRHTWVSGYVGDAVYRADRHAWEALLPHLLWGQATHVGKNATKGNGWYRLHVESVGDEKCPSFGT